MEQLQVLEIIASETGISLGQVKSTVALLDDGNTVPFITRYRKEMTGELDEVKIRHIEERLKFYRNLNARKEEVIRLIQEQGKLNPELQEKIMAATKLTQVEDLYRPYRQKRKTRASVAREKGLEPLAQYLLSFPLEGDVWEIAAAYVDEKKGIAEPEEALQGAQDIVAEDIADDPELRGWVREFTYQKGILCTKAKNPEVSSVYQMYYDFQEPLGRIAPHRVLAINRGVREEVLRVGVEVDTQRILAFLQKKVVKQDAITLPWVLKAVEDGYQRLMAPAVERDIRSQLTEKAEERAVVILSKNLRSLLLQPPVKGKVVLGVDPAYRTGCKWAVVDATGKMLEVGVVYPTPPQNRLEEALQDFKRLVKQYDVDVIAVGNGTASRETEQCIVQLIQSHKDKELQYMIVNEAGASVYSASELAAKEFPQLDASARSAISIARRLQDPLAELVKIDPRSVGVGQYQHDVASKRLEESLASVVESVVNFVGCDINTASVSLLSHIAGVNGAVAENIVQYREEHGGFFLRQQLKKVPRLGPKTFEQCVGFLRISQGKNPLDATAIHPESYDLALSILKHLHFAPEQVGSPALRACLTAVDLEELAQSMQAGLPTVRDIVDGLCRPGRDPRDELPGPLFRSDILTLEDLHPGMELQGTVRNVVDFGAFVDIGVKVDGLVHCSQLSEAYVKHPLDVVALGDVVTVRVLDVDVQRQRVSLSMKGLGINHQPA